VTRQTHRLALGPKRALEKLGADLRAARLRRRLPAAVVAERARTSRPTLARIEKGDPNVSIGLYCSVLNVYGFIERVESLADFSVDQIGHDLDRARLPKAGRNT
jgi:transcriptional regulator with XRE-family HTH domain